MFLEELSNFVLTSYRGHQHFPVPKSIECPLTIPILVKYPSVLSFRESMSLPITLSVKEKKEPR